MLFRRTVELFRLIGVLFKLIEVPVCKSADCICLTPDYVSETVPHYKLED